MLGIALKEHKRLEMKQDPDLEYASIILRLHAYFTLKKTFKAVESNRFTLPLLVY